MQKRVALFICASVAFYKAYELIRMLKKDNIFVLAILSPGLKDFATPLGFEALADECLHEGNFTPLSHIKATQDIDLAIIMPASANTINSLAAGLCPSFFMQSLLACKKPLLIAPAMNEAMLEHFSTQNSLRLLSQNGAIILPTERKTLACGDLGSGALLDIHIIFAHIKRELFKDSFFAQKRLLITAGPCFEDIDEVRAISNYSSGQMGEALAAWGFYLGANILFANSINAKNRPYTCLDFKSSKELAFIIEKHADYDYLIMAAAVSDFIPQKRKGKLKKQEHMKGLDIHLDTNLDILKTTNFKGEKIAFKLEDLDLGSINTNTAQAKTQAAAIAAATLDSKNCLLVCLNSLRQESGELVFGSTLSRLDIYSRKGQDLGTLASKEQNAQRVYAAIKRAALD